MQLPDPLHAIFVGRAGSGKTCAISEAPRPTIVVDVDNKIRTLAYMYPKLELKQLGSYADFDRTDLSSVQYININSFDLMFSSFNAIAMSPPIAPNGEVGTFVMDSLRSIAYSAINYSISMRGGGGKSTGLIPIPDLPEWMAESMFLESVMHQSRRIPCNVILTAHMVIIEREIMTSKADRAKGAPSAGTKVTRQLLTGGTKVAEGIPTHWDEIYNFQAVPSTIYGQPPVHAVFTRVTEECPLARTKFKTLPFELDITDPSPSLWSHVARAMEESFSNVST